MIYTVVVKLCPLIPKHNAVEEHNCSVPKIILNELSYMSIAHRFNLDNRDVKSKIAIIIVFPTRNDYL